MAPGALRWRIEPVVPSRSRPKRLRGGSQYPGGSHCVTATESTPLPRLGVKSLVQDRESIYVRGCLGLVSLRETQDRKLRKPVIHDFYRSLVCIPNGFCRLSGASLHITFSTTYRISVEHGGNPNRPQSCNALCGPDLWTARYIKSKWLLCFEYT